MFGGLKVLVLHGDPESLAGWGLAHESFSAANESVVLEWLRATGADVIACTHTCLPVLWSAVRMPLHPIDSASCKVLP